MSRVAMRLGIAVGSTSVLVLGLMSVNGAQASPDAADSSSDSGTVSAQAKSNYQVCGYDVSASTTTQSGNSSSETASLRSKKGKPSKVRKLRVPPKKVTTKKAKIRWNKPKRTGSTKLKKYQFRLKAKGSKWKKWKGKAPKKLAINKKQKKKQNKFKKVYKNLKPGTSYVVQVRAKNKTGNGRGKKNGVKFQTLPNCTPDPGPNPGPNPGPTNLRSINYTYSNYNKADWTTGGGTLKTLQTTQFVDDIPSVLTVQTPDGDGCIAIFDAFDGKPFATAGSGDPIPVKPPDGSNPQQLTIIPWQSSNGGCNINTDFVRYDASIVIAVFVSKSYYDSPPSNATVCKISAKDATAIDNMALTSSGGNQWTKGDCVIDKPRVRTLNDKKKYTGSLFTMASDGKSKPLYIELADNAILKTPLNALVASTGTNVNPCVVKTQRQIILTGFGRLDSNVGAPPSGNKKEWPGKYLVDSGQLIVNSSSAETFPIDVSGVTISNSPVRKDAAVKLNFDGSCNSKYENKGDTNRAAKVFDVKRIVWNKESDALEVGKKSFVGSSWVLSADDSIKVSSTNQRYEDMTVVQGAAGGVVNIGSYGYNYGTAGSTIEGVYVPRITQQGNSFEQGGGTALVQTLTCPQNDLTGNNPQNVTNVSINNFTVADLGRAPDPVSGETVNKYSRGFSLGIQEGPFCGDLNQDASNVTFGNFQFTNFDIYGDAPGNSELYVNAGTAARQGKSVTLLPIRFCAGVSGTANCQPFPPPPPSAAADRPVTYWSNGDRSFGYYVCGVEDQAKAQQCWNTDGNAQGPAEGPGKIAEAVPNISYTPEARVWEGKVGFPYGP